VACLTFFVGFSDDLADGRAIQSKVIRYLCLSVGVEFECLADDPVPLIK
jgi:hypothetical protein